MLSSAWLWSKGSHEEAQVLLGCFPCPSVEGTQYMEGCRYMCRRDVSVVNNSQDYYSSVAQTLEGVCEGWRCKQCSTSTHCRGWSWTL